MTMMMARWTFKWVIDVRFARHWVIELDASDGESGSECRL